MSDIDFVVLWVDSDDRCWQDDFIRYKTIYSDTYKLAVTPSRFRDMGLLNTGSGLSKITHLGFAKSIWSPVDRFLHGWIKAIIK
ncbi:Uncharacterised protein [Klebsiella michiganensis]|nr:Uncharacterised protein [Klebsiella michiganensis]